MIKLILLPLYALTVAIWTVGETVGAAIAPVIVSEMSPPGLRGLYQGIFGSVWGLAFFIGPALGGFVYDQFGFGDAVGRHLRPGDRHRRRLPSAVDPGQAAH